MPFQLEEGGREFTEQLQWNRAGSGTLKSFRLKSYLEYLWLYSLLEEKKEKKKKEEEG